MDVDVGLTTTVVPVPPVLQLIPLTPSVVNVTEVPGHKFVVPFGADAEIFNAHIRIIITYPSFVCKPKSCVLVILGD